MYIIVIASTATLLEITRYHLAGNNKRWRESRREWENERVKDRKKWNKYNTQYILSHTSAVRAHAKAVVAAAVSFLISNIIFI